MSDAYSPGPKKKRHPLVVAPIHGFLPFAGSRNPLAVSDSARRVSVAIATAATFGMPRLYHFESEAESAVALEAAIDPDLHGLEVQLPPIPYTCRRTGKTRKHHFDLRLTFRDGHRRAVFVRNGRSLGKRETQDEIADIFRCIPPEFAHDAVVVNADDYTRACRDNIRRIWHLSRTPDPAAEAHVEQVARSATYRLLRDLVALCDLEPARVWQSAMRLIGRRVLDADWHAVINVHSRVWLNA